MSSKKQSTLRETLVNTIIENSSDEFENDGDFIQLAIESEEQLITRVISILEWYKDEYHKMYKLK